ncbi:MULTISPECIES: hypothetical protein [unclassified Bradyrhizobium]|uniref:hypothetical protein n=1 Tax=unclassified Bradyrhizobium TaxID=2631580 RepID=UPI002304D373|nr:MULTISPECIES: hypothetical protein [unclassified Bradyrhizobium]
MTAGPADSRSAFWLVRASRPTTIEGKQHRVATKKDDLRQAEEVAEEWYLTLRGIVRSGDLEKVTARKKEKTFQAAAEKFLE